MRQVGLAAMLIVGLIATTDSAASAAPPHRQLVEQVGEITEPTTLVSDPGAPNLLYVSQRDGMIYTLEDGEANLLVDLSSLVAPAPKFGEEALSSIVLAPDFSLTRHFYVDYPSKAEPENIRVEELTASGDPATVLASRRLVIAITHESTSHHFGGQLQFGPDGYLYIATGDGFPTPPPLYPTSSPAQDLEDLLGKLLRIDPDDPDGGGPATYSIPTDNPFVGQSEAKPEIWSLGFRNPFRFSFDRASGDLLIGDVGEDSAEEVNRADSPAPGVVGGAGKNYGWPCREGFEEFEEFEKVNPPGCPAPLPGRAEPVFAYPHSGPESGCAVIGGYVVHDPTLGDLDGRYLYGDFCTGEIKSLLGASSRLEPNLDLEEFELESFGEDACGRQYVLAENVYRIEGDAAASCGQLRVTVSGAGSVSGAGIACPGSCSRLFTAADPLSAVALTPAPAPGWQFAGWEGACGGLGQCAPVVDRERDVTATFVPLSTPPPPPSTPKLSLGKFKANPRTGRGILTIGVTAPGTVTLTGKGIAKVKKHLGGGTAKLKIAAVGRKRQVLIASGKLAVTVKIAYRPDQGQFFARFRKVTLRESG